MNALTDRIVTQAQLVLTAIRVLDAAVSTNGSKAWDSRFAVPICVRGAVGVACALADLDLDSGLTRLWLSPASSLCKRHLDGFLARQQGRAILFRRAVHESVRAFLETRRLAENL